MKELMIDCNTCVKFLFVVFVLFFYYLLVKWRAKSTKEYQDYAKYNEQKKQECEDKIKQTFEEIKRLINEDK